MSDQNRLGDGPIDPHYENVMRALAKGVDEILNGKDVTKETRDVGFILMVFPFLEHGGRCNYISTVRREDVVTLLREQLRRFEEQS